VTAEDSLAVATEKKAEDRVLALSSGATQVDKAASTAAGVHFCVQVVSKCFTYVKRTPR
jgi:hypothetical protein